MAGGTKRLPRAVREQQMLDAAVQEFALNGFRDTSMDAIAAAAKISKPMLYLYYGSKEDLFVACLRRELGRFVEAVRGDIDLTQSPRDVLSTTVVSFLNYVDTHRASWIVIYGQATSTQLFAKQVREGRDRIIELVARLIKAASRRSILRPITTRWRWPWSAAARLSRPGWPPATSRSKVPRTHC